jgi:hypothetical protein
MSRSAAGTAIRACSNTWKHLSPSVKGIELKCPGLDSIAPSPTLAHVGTPLKIESLKVRGSRGIVRWLASDHCAFDFSHLRALHLGNHCGLLHAPAFIASGKTLELLEMDARLVRVPACSRPKAPDNYSSLVDRAHTLSTFLHTLDSNSLIYSANRMSICPRCLKPSGPFHARIVSRKSAYSAAVTMGAGGSNKSSRRCGRRRWGRSWKCGERRTLRWPRTQYLVCSLAIRGGIRRSIWGLIYRAALIKGRT